MTIVMDAASLHIAATHDESILFPKNNKTSRERERKREEKRKREREKVYER